MIAVALGATLSSHRTTFVLPSALACQNGLGTLYVLATKILWSMTIHGTPFLVRDVRSTQRRCTRQTLESCQQHGTYRLAHAGTLSPSSSTVREF